MSSNALKNKKTRFIRVKIKGARNRIK